MPAKSVQQLREEKFHKTKSAQEILDRVEKDNRIFTAEEKKDSNLLLEEADELQKQIDGILEHENQARLIRERTAKLNQVDTRIANSGDPAQNPGQRAQVVPVNMKRVGKLKAFKGEKAEYNAYVSAQWIKATLFSNFAAARWCRENGIEVTNIQTEGVNSAGGFLVPEEFASTIIDLREEYGMFRRNCTVWPMGGDTLSIPRRAGGLTANFTGEGQAIAESTMSWGQVSLFAKKLAALSRLSSELDQDAMISVADTLADEMAYAFAYKEDNVGWNGTGSLSDGGIMGVLVKIIDGTHTASVVAAASGHDTFAEIDHADLTKLMGTLPMYARPGAKWYCSQMCWDILFSRLMAVAGGNSTQTLTGKITPSYLGYPVEISQLMPAVATAINGTPMLAFGDLKKAVAFGERRGISVKQDESRYFEYDQIAIKATERIDIQAHDLGSNSVAGPIVVLNGTT